MSHDLTPHCVSYLVRVEGPWRGQREEQGSLHPGRISRDKLSYLVKNFYSQWHMGNMWPSPSWHERIVMPEMLAAEGTEHSQRELAGRQEAVLK